MENLGLELFNNCYKKTKVLVTGHTGFKGSWLSLWLQNMGAEVFGVALEPLEESHFTLLNLSMNSAYIDIRDRKKLSDHIQSIAPEIIFHMAAQPLVRDSYEFPFETYETNVMGTLNVFEAARKTPSVKAIVNITTDKCYDNKEWVWGYRETDHLGGHDPYSSSKACAEILSNSYRKSFFGPEKKILMASVRAGNVIGGGDWAKDRLIPDIARAIRKNQQVEIRSPQSTRPWQHVLDPLSGYLKLGQKLLEGKSECAQAWNFGPEDDSVISVENLVKEMHREWPKFQVKITPENANLHEAGLLKLDSSKAKTILGWHPTWNAEKTFQRTARWYRNYLEEGKVTSLEDLKDFCELLKSN